MRGREEREKEGEKEEGRRREKGGGRNNKRTREKVTNPRVARVDVNHFILE